MQPWNEKTLAPWKESYDQPREHIKKQRHYFANKGPSSQGYGFSSGHVWMWELDHKESWLPKNGCFWTVELEKTPESPLDCKEIQPVHAKGNQSWIFIGRTDDEAEAPILWPPDAKTCLTGKDPDAGKWRWEEKGTAENEMVGWHHCTVCMLSHFSRVWLFETPLTAARQAALSMGISRQEHWSGSPRPPPGDFPHPGVKPASLVSPVLACGFFTSSSTCGPIWKVPSVTLHWRGMTRLWGSLAGSSGSIVACFFPPGSPWTFEVVTSVRSIPLHNFHALWDMDDPSGICETQHPASPTFS